jgi:glycosyltransferase involved in cell wall biosynthesis
MRIAMLGLKGLPAAYGGVERYADEVAVRLAARGHEVIVFCRAHYTPKEAACASYHGVTLVRQPSLHTKTTDTLSHTLLASLGAMRRRVDVAHYYSLGPAVLSWLPRTVGIPTLAHIHSQEWRGGTWGPIGKAFFQIADRAALRCPTATAAISRGFVEFYRRKTGRTIAFTSTGVALPPPPDPVAAAEVLGREGLEANRYVLFVGRLVPEKSLHVLVDAYEQLRPAVPLVIVGDARTPYADGLRRHASPAIRFLGYRYGRELDALYDNAYLYVHPSFREGLALTVLEAMAHRCCVLASDIPENLEPLGGLGFTFHVNVASDLAAQIDRLLRDPAAVAAQRARARDHVAQHYSWEAVVDRLEAIYVALAAHQPVPTFTGEPAPVAASV